MAPTCMVQEVGTLRGQSQCKELKVVKSCSYGAFCFCTFVYSDTYAAKLYCLVTMHSITDKRRTNCSIMPIADHTYDR